MLRITRLALASSMVALSGCVVALADPLPVEMGVAVPVVVQVAPPPLLVYAQPVAPAPGYLWTPGYWSWNSVAYYWVPGTWVLPPQPGLLWTPGWWGFADGGYRWHRGYWAQAVGFYGGIDYGNGYFGVGFSGGEWRGREFYYNRAVSNVSVTTVRNVYIDRSVTGNRTTVINRVSYNGGAGGVALRPTLGQRAAANERRFAPTDAQVRHRDLARRAPEQRFDAARRPAVFATPHTERFDAHDAVRVPVDTHAPARTADGRVLAPQRDRGASMAPGRATPEQIEAAREALRRDRAAPDAAARDVHPERAERARPDMRHGPARQPLNGRNRRHERER